MHDVIFDKFWREKKSWFGLLHTVSLTIFLFSFQLTQVLRQPQHGGLCCVLIWITSCLSTSTAAMPISRACDSVLTCWSRTSSQVMCCMIQVICQRLDPVLVSGMGMGSYSWICPVLPSNVAEPLYNEDGGGKPYKICNLFETVQSTTWHSRCLDDNINNNKKLIERFQKLKVL